MHFTQVELTSPSGEVEVWWLPVPEKRAKVGEKLTHFGQDWTITQVCTTLRKEDIPAKARIAHEFTRDAMVVAEMSF